VVTAAAAAAAAAAVFIIPQMRLIDVSDPYKLKTLDTYQLTGVKPGAHVVKFDTNTWTAALATYLLDIPGKHHKPSRAGTAEVLRRTAWMQHE